MKVKDFIKLERSGALFRVVDADRNGYMSTDEYLTEADRNVVKNIYGEATVAGFEPKGKKVILYVSQK